MINLKANGVDGLNVGMLKTVSVDLKRLSIVSEENVKTTTFKKRNPKVNTLGNKTPDAYTLI